MSDAKFVCECKEYCASACKGLEFYREVEGKKYCVLHCPVQDKVNDFDVVFRRKLDSSEYNFRGVYFPAAISFKEVNFVSDAVFYKATFSAEADFSKATFSAEADFSGATFSAEADFSEATFSAEAGFSGAKIESYLRFIGTAEKPIFTETASLNLVLAQIAKPEQLIFFTVRLRPHWFVIVDCRKFEFTNVNWVGFGPAKLTWQERSKRKLMRARTAWPQSIKYGVGSEALYNELQAMIKVENQLRLLSITLRQLATNAEDNNQYGDAARFRYASMDARRLEVGRGWDIFTLDWWYWLVSGYGERIPRAAICLLVLMLSFGYLYTKAGFEIKAAPEVAAVVQEITPTLEPLKEMPLPSFWDGLNYAMSAALFQRPEPKAHSSWAKTCVSLEIILVPLQAALLALAIRRRFMR